MLPLLIIILFIVSSHLLVFTLDKAARRMEYLKEIVLSTVPGELNAVYGSSYLISTIQKEVSLDTQKCIQILIECGHDVNCRNTAGIPAISLLLKSNIPDKIPLLELFKTAGVDLNAPDPQGKTPIFYTQTPEILLWLIENGALPDAQDIEGRTCLFYAETQSVRQFLVQNGVNINLADKDGNTLLFRAMSKGDAVQMLKLGANPRIQNDNGNTAPLLSDFAFYPRRLLVSSEQPEELSLAVLRRERSKVIELLNKSYDPDQLASTTSKDIHEQLIHYRFCTNMALISPLRCAILSNQPDLVRLLCQAGAHPDHNCFKRTSALCDAVDIPDISTEIITTLLEFDAPITNVTIHDAIDHNRPDILKLLLDYGITPVYTDYETAVYQKLDECFRLFIDAGCPIPQRFLDDFNKSSNTPAIASQTDDLQKPPANALNIQSA